MRRILIILVVVIGYHVVNAQQMPQYSQYLLNNFVMNPAVAGTEDYYDAKSNHRYQWMGITDAPRTYIFSLHGPIRGYKMGVGAQLYTDITGPTRRTGFQLAYSYHLQVAEGTNLSMGISGGILQFMVDGAKITLENPNDLALSSGIQSVIVPDAGLGFYLYNPKYFFSVSAPQLLPSKLQFFENYDGTNSETVNHIFASGGYIFDITEDIGIEPSGLIKFVSPAPIQMDATLRVIYQSKIWLAGSYRHHVNTNADISIILGYQMQKNLVLAYAYDISMSNIGKYSTGSHELMLAVKFRNRSKSSKRSTDESEDY